MTASDDKPATPTSSPAGGVREAALAFINDLVHMQSAQGWSRAVVRDAAANFLKRHGIPITGHADTTAAIAALSAPASEAVGGSFQQRVQPWMMACFGAEISADVIERNHRFLEEALELVQSTGCTASEAHQLVDYVFGREIGETHQEIGGVMVTLAALCLALGEDMHAAGETELARIWTKVEKIRAKQATKPKHSPLPQHVEPVAPATDAGGVREALERVRMSRSRHGGTYESSPFEFYPVDVVDALLAALSSTATPELVSAPANGEVVEGGWDSLNSQQKAVVSAWNYMQSPDSYSADEKRFVCALLDRAHTELRVLSNPAPGHGEGGL